jgi:hypothetical protein
MEREPGRPSHGKCGQQQTVSRKLIAAIVNDVVEIINTETL